MVIIYKGEGGTDSIASRVLYPGYRATPCNLFEINGSTALGPGLNPGSAKKAGLFVLDIRGASCLSGEEIR